MATFRSKAISIFVFFTFILSILNIFIVVTFFTNDKIIKYTISQAPSVDICMEHFTRPETESESENQPITVPTQTETVAIKETNIPTPVGIEEKSAVTVSTRSSATVSTKEVTKSEPTPSTLSSNYNGYNSLGKIQIPKTGVDLNILSNVSINGLEIASCFLYSTGTLNESGNTLIVGHNYRNGKLFSNNNLLQIGDIIYITTLDGKKVTYTIYDKFITTPEDISYIKKNSSSNPSIALSCCTDDNAARLIILAKSE